MGKIKSQVTPTIFFMGLVILPLFFWPWAPVPYEIPKVWLFQRWVEILIISGLIFNFKNLSQKTDLMFVFLLSAFTITAFLSSFFGVDFNKSFWGNYYRDDGLLTLIHLVAFSLFLKLLWNEDYKKLTSLAITMGCFFISLLSLFEGFKLHVLGDQSVANWNGAIGTVFGQPNFLAGYLLVTLPFVAYLYHSDNNRLTKIFSSLVLFSQIMAIILTQSKGGILGIFLFFFLVFFFPIIIKISLKKLSLLLLPAIILVVFLSIILSRSPDPLHPESRTRIITRGLLAFTQRPFLGWGWANFDAAFEAHDWPVKYLGDVYVDKAHSTLLEILTTTGLVGFILYLAIIADTAKRLYPRSKKDGLWSKFSLLALILILFHSQTNVISISEEMIFWLIVGASSPHSKGLVDLPLKKRP